jgi:hypothetical protein
MNPNKTSNAWEDLPCLAPSDLGKVHGGMFGVRVAWQILKSSTPAGAPHGQHDPLTIADQKAKASAQAQAQAQWNAITQANPALIKPFSIQEQLQWRADLHAQQAAKLNAAMGAHPNLVAGKK